MKNELIRHPECLVCSGRSNLIGHGVLAPFVAQILNKPWIPRLNLLGCSQCGFRWFSYRYSDDEVATLYGQYREKPYVKIRRRWEPWYLNSVNNAYTGESVLIDKRVLFMTEILENHLGTADLVVDIGGDEGQFFPNIPIKRRVVLDVSNKNLRPNVERVSSLQELDNIDLIIAAHILEHVSNPVDFLRQLASKLSAGAFLYVEVPLDTPQLSDRFNINRNVAFLNIISNFKIATVFFDFLTGLKRNFNLPLGSSAVLKQSEHINYFSMESLVALAATTGLDIINSGSNSDARTGNFKLGKLGILLQK